MTEENKISVCLATYNGEKYIKEQLESILRQLKENDEVIVSDDHSTDQTLEIVKSFNDRRIKIFSNNSIKGPVGNFGNAISKSSGEIIFLSDQDDVWKPNKVQVVLKFFTDRPECTCVFSNAEIIDKSGVKTGQLFFKNIPSTQFLKMLVKNNFLGCTMAFRNKINIIPFAPDLPMHDWYIGLKHIQRGRVAFIDIPLISYRRHGENVTTGKSSNILQIIKWRIQILKALYLS